MTTTRGNFSGAISPRPDKSKFAGRIGDLVKRGEFAGAIKLVDQTRRRRQAALADNFLFRMKSEIYFHKGDYANALRNIERAIDIRPTEYYASLKASILLNMKAYARIIEEFADSAEALPHNVAINHAMCVAHFDRGDIRAAQEFGRRVLQTHEASAGARRFPLASGEIAAGDGRRVAAFSLWGKDKVFTQGAILNCVLIHALMPGWTPRFYVDASVPKSCLARLEKLGAEVVRGDRDYRLVPRSMWRFLVADDKSVARFVCRDCDSRPSMRDVTAVLQWVASGRSFHVLRDHPFHVEPVLAGLWGGVAGGVLRMAERVTAFLEDDRYGNAYGNDQRFLREFVWPDIREHALVHDPFYGNNGARPLPDYLKWSEADHAGRCFKDEKEVQQELKFYGISVA